MHRSIIFKYKNRKMKDFYLKHNAPGTGVSMPVKRVKFTNIF